jgi:hypothetical protein
LVELVFGVTLGVGQPIDHPLRGFPGDSTVAVEIPHRFACLFPFLQDFCD